MKIMYVEIATTGHRVPYLKALINNSKNEIITILPKKVEELECKQYICEFDNNVRTFKNHQKWISEICKYAKEEKPDVIHFLTGDVFYRFFGFGLTKFKRFKTILTFHSVKTSCLQKLSLRIISKLVTKLVFHSGFMKEQAESLGIKNSYHIEYPVFGGKVCDVNEAREYFNLKKDVPVIGCIGGTRYDKGLDILLEALKNVEKPFQLLVAGKAEDFNEEYIKDQIKSYEENVKLVLRFLTEEELMYAMNATDIVALPYRKEFNGASGPLGEGVALGKCIIGPNHGNLKDTIEKNHLGYTFESENLAALLDVLKLALKKEFVADPSYSVYKKTLRVSSFIESYNDLYQNK